MDTGQFHILTIASGGVLFIVFYIVRTTRRNNYLRKGIKTTGTVVDVVRDVDMRRGGMYYYPVVKFALQNGDWYEKQYSDGNFPSAYKKGDKVTVVYKEDEPKSYIITQHSFKDIIFLFIGLAVLSYAAYVYFIK